jgi:hypothetical protein
MKTFLLLSAFALTGCTHSMDFDKMARDMRAEASAGHIGCPQTEIVVTEQRRQSWTATCRGRVFYCTEGGGTACKEAIKPT